MARLSPGEGLGIEAPGNIAMKPFGWAALSLALWLPAHADLPDSVSQSGITWVFDKPHETGQFVNGDWWVAGP